MPLAKQPATQLAMQTTPTTQAIELDNQYTLHTSTNSYAKPALWNYYKFGKPGHRSNVGSERSSVYMVEDVTDEGEGVTEEKVNGNYDEAKHTHEDGEQIIFIVQKSFARLGN